MIGASRKELQAPSLYLELGRCFPGTSFELTFFGPELPSGRVEPLGQVSFALRPGEYRRNVWSRLPRPDLVIGYNAGLLVYPTWVPTLRELLGSGLRVALTSYRIWEAAAEAELLLAARVTCLSAPAQNPFRSLAWRRSSTIANDLSQDNAYLSVWMF